MSYRPSHKRRQDDHQGIDDWLMTYADMITLLLCFFAVFLSVSTPKKEIFDQAREKVLEQFSSENIMAGKFPTPPGRMDTGAQTDALPSIIDQYHSGEGRSVGPGVDAGEGQSEGFGEGLERGTDDTEGEYDTGEEVPEGDRITTFEMPSAALFDSGSAALKEEGKALLLEIVQNQLNAAEFQGYQITIEGHTDDVPINTLQFPSNWELSTARAAGVVRFFIENGVDPARLRAAGYADIFPKSPNRNESGVAIPENQAQNRRVVIKLEKIEKTD